MQIARQHALISNDEAKLYSWLPFQEGIKCRPLRTSIKYIDSGVVRRAGSQSVARRPKYPIVRAVRTLRRHTRYVPSLAHEALRSPTDSAFGKPARSNITQLASNEVAQRPQNQKWFAFRRVQVRKRQLVNPSRSSQLLKPTQLGFTLKNVRPGHAMRPTRSECASRNVFSACSVPRIAAHQPAIANDGARMGKPSRSNCTEAGKSHANRGKRP